MLKRLASEVWRGSRARAALADARRDLEAMALPAAVQRRAALPLAPSRRVLSLRAANAALASRLAREGETHVCLVRSLALFELAREHGFDVRLVIGVRKDATGGLDSHAWLTLDGAPFLEGHALTTPYETMTVLPDGPSASSLAD